MRAAILPFLVAFCFPALTAAPVSGNDDKAKVFADVSGYASECWAYFNTVSRCLSKDPNLKKTYDGLAEQMLQASFFLGKEAGMSDAALQSRMRLNNSSMEDAISSNCVNFSVLIEKHQQRCVALALELKR
ncbi:MAG: hypothetical protein K0U74_12035 [Alphaproteobacteria bacterium]|nr:hypothetical protein [Alphaproteobacteria bacterium]